MVAPTAMQLKRKALEISERKVAVESRMRDIGNELETMPGAPGLIGNLVDKEASPACVRKIQWYFSCIELLSRGQSLHARTLIEQL